MRIISLIPDMTGWVALYNVKDVADVEHQFIPIVGWALTDQGNVLAFVPSNDGSAVPCVDYHGLDGELEFDTLSCSHCEDDGEA